MNAKGEHGVGFRERNRILQFSIISACFLLVALLIISTLMYIRLESG
jgi:hypothetical protein